MFKFLKRNINYILFLSIFTFVVSEITSIFLISNTESKKNISVSNSTRNIKNELNNANINIKYERTITGMKENLDSEEVRFRTDNIGSIIPSSLNNIKETDEYILFCGGSTTEASQVHEGGRPTDIFMKFSNYRALNLAKAGKGFEGCLNTIRIFHENLSKNTINYKKPKLYIFSININTLSDFLRVNFSEVKKSQSLIRPFGVNLFSLLKNKLVKLKRNKFFGINISNYEHALIEGCCFAPSNINNPKDYPKLTYWNKKELKNSYEKFLDYSLNKLDILLSDYEIPRKKVKFFIEPNSFHIEYKSVYRDYWKNDDARQLLHDFSGRKLSNFESFKLINDFDNVYKFKIENNGFDVIQINNKKFPKWSFYDAVHYTDYGSFHIGNFYANEINLLIGN